jgi:hypothetical protein
MSATVYRNWPTTMHALCPPKPKLLLSAARIERDFGTLGV